MAPELLGTVDLQAADHVPFTSAAVMEEGQTPYGGSSANYHDSTSEHGLLHSAQIDNGPMIKVTVWRLLNTIVVLGLGIYKAVAAYLGQPTTPTTLDWVIGVFWAVMGYWVSFLEDAQLGPRGRWFFTQDHSAAVLSILTIRMILSSDPEEVDTTSPLQVPRSTIAITHEDDRREGFSASDQTGGGSAPDFSTTNLDTSALDLPGRSPGPAPLELSDVTKACANVKIIHEDDRRDGFATSDQTADDSAPDFSTTHLATSASVLPSGSSESAPLEVGDVIKARANVTEGSENLGRGEIHNDSGTFDTTTSAASPSILTDVPTSALLNNRRRRAMIACINCRRRKIKCVTSEEPPQHPCARCTKRGLVCEYAAVDESTTPESPTQSNYNPARYGMSQNSYGGSQGYSPQYAGFPQKNPSGGSQPLNPPYYGTFNTTTSATSASDSSGGAAQSLPFALGEIIEPPANITEDSANLRRRKNHDDSGTFDTTTSATSALDFSSRTVQSASFERGDDSDAFDTATPATSASDSSGGASRSALSGIGSMISGGIFSSPSESHYRGRLNNTAQAYGWVVSYETSWSGPQVNPWWTAIAYVNNIEYGRGYGGSKESARENASKEVLLTLGILQA
ncbi:C6 finger domain [Mycena sanguinolenta]|uniref:C6 finger domain n=1 Tax=Mycena sanguinolenta TaxID=230812 RepID=A0A8H6U0Q4_9AGAR|nr:C6 finger domain [Mycena sanguinolenta]